MRKHAAWILLPAAVLLLLAAMLVTAQLRETVKLFAPLSPEAVQAVMAARQAPEAYELGRGALEAAGYNAVAFADNDDLKLLGQKAE